MPVATTIKIRTLATGTSVGGDVLRAVRVAAQRPAQHEDLLAEVGLVDERGRPDDLQQLVLRQDTIPLLDQEQQQVERLGCQRLRHAVAQQRALGRVEEKRPE